MATFNNSITNNDDRIPLLCRREHVYVCCDHEHVCTMLLSDGHSRAWDAVFACRSNSRSRLLLAPMLSRYRAHGTVAKEMTPTYRPPPVDGTTAMPAHVLALALNLGGSQGSIPRVPVGGNHIVAMQDANPDIVNTLRDQDYHVHSSENCLVAVRRAIGRLTPFPNLLITGNKPKWQLEATGASIEFHTPICGVHRFNVASMHIHNDIAKHRNKPSVS